MELPPQLQPVPQPTQMMYAQQQAAYNPAMYPHTQPPMYMPHALPALQPQQIVMQPNMAMTNQANDAKPSDDTATTTPVQPPASATLPEPAETPAAAVAVAAPVPAEIESIPTAATDDATPTESQPIQANPPAPQPAAEATADEATTATAAPTSMDTS